MCGFCVGYGFLFRPARLNVVSIRHHFGFMVEILNNYVDGSASLKINKNKLTKIKSTPSLEMQLGSLLAGPLVGLESAPCLVELGHYDGQLPLLNAVLFAHLVVVALVLVHLVLHVLNGACL